VQSAGSNEPDDSPWQTAGSSLPANGKTMTTRIKDNEHAVAIPASEANARTRAGAGTLMLATLVLVSIAAAVCALVYLLLLAFAPGENRASFLDLDSSPVRVQRVSFTAVP
jgi:hypothetical protein